eukprot:scaffold16736_cov110-Skeletonema_dohrnii-CCMP3373.AAC.3
MVSKAKRGGQKLPHKECSHYDLGKELKIVMQHIDASCMPMMRQLSILLDGVDCKMSFNCVLVS